jgi:hypothetical protein
MKELIQERGRRMDTQQRGFRDTQVLVNSPSFEKHYRVGELADIWGLGRETVRRLVKDDPGVIKIRLGRKKTHTVYSIPESAARRIHTRLLSPA